MAPNKARATGNDLGLINVMITRFSAMGNVVMTIPVVYSACRCYKDIRFVMVTKKSLTGLYINPPSNLTVVGIDIKEDYSGVGGALRFVKDMTEKYHIDSYVDLQNDTATTLIALLCRLRGIKVARFNRASSNKRKLTRKANKVMLPLTPSAARYRETFFKVGLPIDERFDSLFGKSAKAAPQLYAKITGRTKPEGMKWIGIAPFAAHPEKEYPTDKMEQVIRMLIKHGGVHIYIYGGDGREAEIARKWADDNPEVTSLAGNKYGFASELALLSNLDAMITMDSANMHLAALVGIPTVSIWGATHHYCGFKGWHQSEDEMVQVPLSCRPCSIKGDKACYRHDLLCLTAIRPETIYDKIIGKINDN